MFVHCCHCTDCQRQTGSAFVINALIETSRVEVLSGTTVGVPVPTDSGRPHVIHRCPTCQTALWSHYGGREAIAFVRVGDARPARRRPARRPHLHALEAALGRRCREGVPAFEEYYDSRALWPPESLARRKAALSG